MRSRSVTLLMALLTALAIRALPAAAQHKITTFNVQGSGTSPTQGTYAQAINQDGMIAGYYIDGAYRAHGFLRYGHDNTHTIDAGGRWQGLAEVERMVDLVDDQRDAARFQLLGKIRDLGPFHH